MAAGKWKLYESAKEYIGDGTIDLDTNSFEMRLYLSTSNANTLTTNTVKADLTNEHAAANGYAAQTVTMTWAHSGGTATLDSDNPVFTASGGSITARWAVIIRTGTVNTVTDALLAVCYLDYNGGSPLDVTATDTNTLTVSMNASGIVALSGAASDT